MEHNLKSDEIDFTINLLHRRINERFPASGLGKVCAELGIIAKESESRCKWIKKPQIILRIGVGIAIAMMLVILLFGIGNSVKFSSIEGIEFTDFLQVLEAGMNTVVLVGAALFFLVTTEIRRKRRRAMAAIYQLRALAHVIDMHQLTKDPERVFAKNRVWTASSPRTTMNAFELTRYLDYCTEMLSLVGKIAALYAQYSEDTAVLTAVNDVENLTTGLSRKIWQKIVILHREGNVI